MAEDRVTRTVVGLVRAGNARPKTIILLVLVATGALAAGLPHLSTEVDVLDILPPDDPNTQAARALEERFQSAYLQQVNIDLPINAAACRAESTRLIPTRLTEEDCAFATDEVYLRAMDEFDRFITNHDDSAFQFALSMHSIYRLVNWTAEGGEDAPLSAFAMPPRTPDGAARYRLIDDYIRGQVPDFIRPFLGHENRSVALVLIAEQGTTISLADLGHNALEMVDAFVAAVDAGETDWRLWGADDPPGFYVDLAVGSAHGTDLVREDVRLLVPLIGGFILATLYLGFRNVRGMLFGGAVLATSGIWVFGTLGWVGISVNSFTLAVIPLLLGIGIDMAIHLMTSFQAARQACGDDRGAFSTAARRAGFAMLLATLTTVAGLTVLAFSPSPLIVEMAWASSFAVASVFVLSMTLLPALVSWTGSGPALGRSFRPSRLMQGVGRHVHRHRAAWGVGTALLVVAGSVTGAWIGVEPFGEFALNFPEDDEFRQAHEEQLQAFYHTLPGEPLFITNVLVLEGDMVDPATHDWIRAIAAGLETKPNVRTQTMTHLPFLVENYAKVKDGLPGAVVVTGQETLLPLFGQEPDRPDTRDEIFDVLEAGRKGPMRTFGAMFVDYPAYEMSVITFSTATGDFDGVEASWRDVWAAVDEAENLRPPGATVGFAGNTATNYIFVHEELPWLGYLAIASFGVVGLLILVFTRDWRAALFVAGLVTATTGAWMGLLVLMGIGLSIYLVVPVVFISAIGSDYAVHMVWALRQEGRLDAVFGVVGKAILFGALTDAGAFALFAFAQDVPLQRTMIAAALAVGTTFILSAILVAVAADWLRRGAPSEPSA